MRIMRFVSCDYMGTIEELIIGQSRDVKHSKGHCKYEPDRKTICDHRTK